MRGIPTRIPIMFTNDENDADELLLSFVRNRDHPCPRCGYNLRNLTRPVCPECKEPLLLKVGVQKLKLVCLLLAIAPGMFCLIALGIFLIMSMRFGGPGIMRLEEALTLVFMAVSGIVAIGLAARTRAFLRLTDPTQAMWMILIWIVHLMVFGLIVSRV